MIFSYIKFFLLIFFIIYFLYGCLLYFGQEMIIFYPVAYNLLEIKDIEKKYPNFKFQIIELANYKITYWENIPNQKNYQNIVLYFGGNAENTNYSVLGLITYPPILRYKWYIVNYPGYNGSSSFPSEKTFFESAISFYDYILELPEYKNKKIIVIGRSIGSGVALYLASKKKVDKLILITPFDSLETIAQKYYPFYPVSFLLRHKFENKKHIKKINSDLLVMIANKDNIIPHLSTDNFLRSIPGTLKTYIYYFENADHNSIGIEPGYYSLMYRFIENEL